jgi:hypothetical protein
VEPLKDVSIKQTETFTVRVTLPPGTKPGDYAFKIVVANDANPEEESTEGPAVMLHVGARTKPAFLWWWILIGVGIVALAVGISFFVRWLIQSRGACSSRRPRAPSATSSGRGRSVARSTSCASTAHRRASPKHA